MDTILFDLDGTLLPMDAEAFTNIYFQEMGAALADLIHPKELVKHIWASTECMVRNVEERTNEDVFMEDFQKRIGGDILTFKNRFDEFYDNGFLKAKKAVHNLPLMQESVALLREKGYKLVVATNPLFPLKAILHRIKWAGFEPEMFSYISCYENNHYCKPQVHFYNEILQEIHKKPEDCLMVGNDVQEDLISRKLGITTFLIKNYLIHRSEDEIQTDYQGFYEDFFEFVKDLPSIVLHV